MNSPFELCDFISGSISGACGILIGHPGDTVKVRQQTDKQVSLLKTVSSIYTNEGVRGYYKGVVFPLLSAGVTNSIFFGFYAGTLRLLLDKPLKACDPTNTPNWHWKALLAGGVGGFFSVFIGCPVELVKVRLQIDKGKSTIGTRGMVERIYKEAGIRGLYKGIVPTMMRDVPGYAIYVVVFEHLLCKFKQTFSSESLLFCEMMSGGVAGVASWAPIMPADVIKSRIQADTFFNPKYKGAIDCLVKTYRTEGFRILYKGVLICVLRAFPVNVVTFTVYVNFVKSCDRTLYGASK